MAIVTIIYIGIVIRTAIGRWGVQLLIVYPDIEQDCFIHG